MHVEHFHDFIVLAEEQSYREAAKRLCIAQSTLSKHIAALEAHYHTRLFERGKTYVNLTSNGQILLEQAIEIWSAYEQSKRLVGGKAEEQRGLYISGVLDSPGIYPIVSEVISEFIAATGARPPHLIPCTSTSVNALAQTLRTKEANVAIFNFEEPAIDELEDASSFKSIPVCHIPLSVIVNAKSDLAAKGHVRLADLAGRTFVQIVGPRFASSWKQIEHHLDQSGIPYTTHPVAAFSYYDYINIAPRDAVLLVERPNAPKIASHMTAIPIAEEDLTLEMRALCMKDNEDSDIELFAKLLGKHYLAHAQP